MVEWSGAASLRLESMKRLNIKSLAICFSKASSLSAYQAVIEAKQSHKRKGRNGNNTQDPEADYNVKIAADGKRKTTCGYKMIQGILPWLIHDVV
jgi:hypothetical protein